MILIASLFFFLGANPKAGFALSFDEIQEKGTISIAVYRDFRPFSYRENGVLKGIDVEIAKEIAKSLNVSLDLIEQTADENVDDDLRNAIWKGHYLKTPLADVMLHIPYDQELGKRNELVVLFAPYYLEDTVLAKDIEKIGKEATIAYFRFEKVGVELDSLSDAYLSSVFGGTIRNNLKHYINNEIAANALKKGETTGLLGIKSQLEHHLRGEKNIVIEKVPTPGLYKESWLLGLAVKNTYRQLGYNIGDIIATLIKNGRMQAIFEEYNVTYSPPPSLFL